MKKLDSKGKNASSAKSGKKSSEDGRKKAGTLKPQKSKEVKRSRNPADFDDDEDFFDDSVSDFDDFDSLNLDLDDED